MWSLLRARSNIQLYVGVTTSLEREIDKAAYHYRLLEPHKLLHNYSITINMEEGVLLHC